MITAAAPNDYVALRVRGLKKHFANARATLGALALVPTAAPLGGV